MIYTYLFRFAIVHSVCTCVTRLYVHLSIKAHIISLRLMFIYVLDFASLTIAICFDFKFNLLTSWQLSVCASSFIRIVCVRFFSLGEDWRKEASYFYCYATHAALSIFSFLSILNDTRAARGALNLFLLLFHFIVIIRKSIKKFFVCVRSS